MTEPTTGKQNSIKLTLGITKIGDLLIKNKITNISTVDEKLEDGIEAKLNVPDYQRPYKWTAINAIRLLDDIEEGRRSNREKYRVGTLILCEKEGAYDIVDGQQRLITFSLLLKCCKEKLGGNNDNIEFLNQELTDNPYNKRNVPQNYRALERRVELLERSDLSGLYDYIKQNCEMIVVITDDVSEAFQFFDSQNARGKKLYPHDLLKAYHLREMDGSRVEEKEEVVKLWEEINQKELAELFSEYLYRLKKWIKGDKADDLNEHNIDTFKGISGRDTLPCAQYHKSAFAYIDTANNSYIPLVVGVKGLSLFQIDAPVIAGKPFFEYAKHYYELLKDIRNNDKYVGFFVNGNPIVETLNKDYKNGAGNEYTRLLFDNAILLYVDRFCHTIPSKEELEFLDQFIVYAFIWAYSLRLQYATLQWDWAQNYVMGNNDKVNSFNIYKLIVEAANPKDLFGKLSEKLLPVPRKKEENTIEDWFSKYNFLQEKEQ